MADVATLGVKVESSELSKLDSDLKRVTTSATSAEGATQRLTAATLANSRASANAAGAHSKVSAGLKKVGTEGEATGGVMAKMSAGIGTFGTAVVATVAAVVVAMTAAAAAGAAALKVFIDATSEAEEVQADLTASLRATSYASGQTMDSLNAHAQALQKVTTFSDEAIGSAQAILLTYTNLRGEGFERATVAVTDLATKFKMDLPSAARLLGKAMEDPLLGMTALRRMGVFLTDDQQKLVEGFVKVNDAAKAQGVILDAVDKSMAGLAQEQRGTLGGTLTALNNAFGDLFELGPKATKGVKDSINELIEAINNKAFKDFVQLIGEGLFNAFSFVIDRITDTVSLVEKAGRVFETMGSAVAAAKMKMDIDPAMISRWRDFTENVFKGMSMNIFAGGLKGPISGLSIDAITKDLDTIVGAVNGAWNTLTTVSKQSDAVIAESFIDVTNQMNQAVREWAESPTSAGNIMVIQLKKMANAIVNDADIPNTFRDAGDKWGTGLGEQFKSGFTKSISGFFESIAARVTAAAQMRSTSEGILNPNNPGGFGLGVPQQALVAPSPPIALNQGGGGGGKKNPYDEAVKSANEFIAKQQLEAKVLGLTAAEADKQRFALDLVNKATNDNNQLTPVQAENLRRLAASMAEAKAATDTSKFMQTYKEDSESFIRQQEMEERALYMGATAASAYRMEFEALERARKANVEITPDLIASIHNTASAMATVESRVKDQKELMNLGRDVFKGFFSDMREGLMQGQTLWESFGNAALNALNRIAEKLVSMAAEKLFEAAFGGAAGAGGGFLGGIFSSIFGSGSSAIPTIGGGTMDMGGAFTGIGSGTFGGFAEGGRPPVGTPYLVGENGPEVRIDDRPGTILNEDQWGSRGGVTLNQVNNFGSDVTKSTMASWANEIEKRSIAGAQQAMLDNRRRGGQSKQVFGR